MNNKKTFGLLQVRYIKQSIIGQVIEDFKLNEPNVSRVVRDYIMYHRGYDILKNKSISTEELQKICLNNYQYFASQFQISKINLQRLNDRYYNHLVLNNFPADDLAQKTPLKYKQSEQKVGEKEQIIIPETSAKDKSFIKSLLPK